MDFKRADHILNSKEIYEVFFMGTPVWLAELHPDRATADIAESPFTTNRTREVSTEELMEGKRIQ